MLHVFSLCLRSEFCTLRTMASDTREFWAGRGGPALCTVLGSISDLYPLDVSSTTPLVATTKDVSRCCQRWALLVGRTARLPTATGNHHSPPHNSQDWDDSQLFSFTSAAECHSRQRYSALWGIDFTFSWIHLNWRVLFFETAQQVVVLICH